MTTAPSNRQHAGMPPEPWAEWIAVQLEAAGSSTMLQAWEPLATGAAIPGCRALGVRARVEAHRMATGPLLGRGEDAESIEDNRFSPTDTRGA